MIPFEYLEHTADVKFRAYGKTPEEFLFETESAVFASFRVQLRQNGSWKLAAEIGGERIDLKRHSFENEVKAITMHQFQIKKNELNDLWCIQVILDV